MTARPRFVVLLDGAPVAETGSLATALAEAETGALRLVARRPETRWGEHGPGEWRLDTRATWTDDWVWSMYSIVESPTAAAIQDLPALADALDAAHVRLTAEVDPQLLAGGPDASTLKPGETTPAFPCPTDARRQS